MWSPCLIYKAKQQLIVRQLSLTPRTFQHKTVITWKAANVPVWSKKTSYRRNKKVVVNEVYTELWILVIKRSRNFTSACVYVSTNTAVVYRVWIRKTWKVYRFVLEHSKTGLYFLWRAPQQMLRTHRSLEAYCETLWWRWLFVLFFRVMEHRWNEIARGKPKDSGRNLSHCHLVYPKSHMDWPGIKPEPLQWEAGD
jgi:hypothetical protein